MSEEEELAVQSWIADPSEELAVSVLSTSILSSHCIYICTSHS